MGHRKYIKQFIVAGTWILNKLIIIMLCFFYLLVIVELNLELQ